MTDNDASTDIGAPVSYQTLKDGTPVFDRAGDPAGAVGQVLADEQADIFHGLILTTEQHGHRFARAELVDGLFERGVIIAVPASELPEPSVDPAARQAEQDAGLGNLPKKAWDWLAKPK